MKNRPQLLLYLLLTALSIWYWIATLLSFTGQGTRLSTLPAGTSFGTTIAVGVCVLALYAFVIYKLFLWSRVYAVLVGLLILLFGAALVLAFPLLERKSIEEASTLAQKFANDWSTFAVSCDDSAVVVCSAKPKVVLAPQPKYVSNLFGRYEFWFDYLAQRYTLRLDRGYYETRIFIYSDKQSSSR